VIFSIINFIDKVQVIFLVLNNPFCGVKGARTAWLSLPQEKWDITRRYYDAPRGDGEQMFAGDACTGARAYCQQYPITKLEICAELPMQTRVYRGQASIVYFQLLFIMYPCTYETTLIACNQNALH
jgi:hypothetical protein